MRIRFSVIPADPGSGPGQAPESSVFKWLKIIWTPVFTGVTTSYEIITLFGFIFYRSPDGKRLHEIKIG